MQHKKLAVAFSGPSNSGKTTLIEKLILVLAPKYKITAIKHDPKNKAIFDTEGKDSYRFFQAGANVIVTSPQKTALFYRYEMELESLLQQSGDADLVLIEGLKHLPLKRIGIFRGKFDESYTDYLHAVAIDHTVETDTIPRHLDVLDLNEIDTIIEWIFTNATEIQ